MRWSTAKVGHLRFGSVYDTFIGIEPGLWAGANTSNGGIQLHAGRRRAALPARRVALHAGWADASRNLCISASESAIRQAAGRAPEPPGQGRRAAGGATRFRFALLAGARRGARRLLLRCLRTTKYDTHSNPRNSGRTVESYFEPQKKVGLWPTPDASRVLTTLQR